MKAFILAAGLGTRLFPYTSDKPKALVELNGVTLLERAIRKVHELEISETIINIHHFGNQIVDFLNEKHYFNLPITISDEGDQLLDTGGAILKAHSLLGDDEPFLVYNVDILSSIDLKALNHYHIQKAGIATMAVRERSTDRYLVFNPEMRLSGWRNVKTGEEILTEGNTLLHNLAFSGIQIVDPKIFPLITETGKFSVIQLYLRLAKEQYIFGYHDPSEHWMDLGKPDQLIEAQRKCENWEM
ncbi:MAG: nucleotidyltransferase family protein [Prolixibacteraceae bacterium]